LDGEARRDAQVAMRLKTNAAHLEGDRVHFIHQLIADASNE
jgi:hypothetical protein